MWWMLIGAVCACVSLSVLLSHGDEVHKVQGWALALIGGVFMVLSLVPKETGEYYMPAEIAAQNTYATFFVTEDGNVFVSEKRPWHNENSPYLLSMDTMGTTQIEDDEIRVVWRTE